jgi:hypothetical protein
MTQRTTLVRIPAPCHESWDAMTPAHGGRHCATCQKTVVDFTLKTDAEILAFFSKPASIGACGHFRTSQLARPLQPARLPGPAQRWRGWLATALALWGLRAEATSTPLAAPLPPSAQHPRRKPAPVPPTRQVARRLVSGVVRDQYSLVPVARARVKLKGGHQTVITDANGYFRLWLPARRGPHTQHTLLVQQADYVAKRVRVPLSARAARALHVKLAPEPSRVPDEMLTTGGTPIMEVIAVTDLPATNQASKADTLAAPAQALARPWYQRLAQPFRRAFSSR